MSAKTSYTGILVNAILELATVIEGLKGENAELRAENARLKVVEEQAENLFDETYGNG